MTIPLHIALQQAFFPICIPCCFIYELQPRPLSINDQNTHSKKLGVSKNASFTLTGEANTESGTCPEAKLENHL